MSRSGNLFVVSGPSGVGKGTILQEVFDHIDDGWYSVSVTTREPRSNETEGIDYYFVDETQFDDLVCSDGLLEWAPVHSKRYGTPRAPIDKAIEKGNQVLLDIDVAGAAQIKESMPECVMVFIEPPSMEVLEQRLRGRGTDSEEQIVSRLKQAIHELSLKSRYNYTVVNDNLSQAVDQVLTIIDNHASS
ncbi:MAG: guanylate kinase [Coriobacteriia bacterium]|nr:guanylate kinase [Coriobacteriia bacterium]